MLVFCSYLASIERLRATLFEIDPQAYVGTIDGSVPARDRQEIVDDFSSTVGPGCLVLQIDTAGTGLNITAANHVIFFNPDWNPAKAKQAAARAFRRGQSKPVMVHHLFYADTIEEDQVVKAQSKQDIADSVAKGMANRLGDDV